MSGSNFVHTGPLEVVHEEERRTRRGQPTNSFSVRSGQSTLCSWSPSTGRDPLVVLRPRFALANHADISKRGQATPRRALRRWCKQSLRSSTLSGNCDTLTTSSQVTPEPLSPTHPKHAVLSLPCSTTKGQSLFAHIDDNSDRSIVCRQM